MLELDQKLVEKYGITDEHELSPEDKKAFVREQVEQVKKIAWRTRVDLMVINASSPHNEDEAEEKARKIKEYQKELDKYTEAITSFNRIYDELDA